MKNIEKPTEMESQLLKIRRRLIKLFSLWLLIPVLSVSSVSAESSQTAYFLTGAVSLFVVLVSVLFIFFYRDLFRRFWADNSIRIRLILLILTVPFLSISLNIKMEGVSNIPVFIYLVIWSSLGYSILFNQHTSDILRSYINRDHKDDDKN